MVKNKKLLYVGFAFEIHLRTHAGYHQIKDYLNYDKIIDGQSDYNFVFNTIEKLPKFIIHYYRKFFGYRLWFTELRCILRAIFYRNQVFHIIYGENIFKHLGKFKGKSNKVICTYHLPVSLFKENYGWVKSIKYLDKIILVSSNNLDYYYDLDKNIPVKFIPHGVNTEFYIPGHELKEKILLMVGDHLRDFSFANIIFAHLLKEDKDIRIVVVTSKENFIYFDADSRLTLLFKIPDEQLRNLYQKAALLFLPLVEFTASNAILEASACDTKILIATDSKNTSYFDSNYISFIKLDPNLVIDYILNYLSRLNGPNNSREYVLNNYSWGKIGKITKSYLEE